MGKIVTIAPSIFGSAILTSNFDPLIEIAIQVAGGQFYKTVLHRDGNIDQTMAQGCHVIHLHGYWYGADTLHTPRQLTQPRPQLQSSLLNFLKNKTVVVLAYGGWNDIFMRAITSIVSDDYAYPQILWTLYGGDSTPSDELLAMLRPGLDRGRVTFYRGMDCHQFLPQLAELWIPRKRALNQIEHHELDLTAEAKRGSLPQTELECDRPPEVEAWVGRDKELATLLEDGPRVIAICGIGGQGKSALTARYLKLVTDGEPTFDRWDWRDCREEGDVVRTKIIAAIVRMTRGEIRPNELLEESSASLAEIFVKHASGIRCLFIFDNVDGYIDLENGKFTGTLGELVSRAIRSLRGSRLVLTCRPLAQTSSPSILVLPLTGLSIDEAVELFRQRGAKDTPRIDIESAHRLTDGHALWLDLMAVQVGRVPGVTLKGLIEDSRRGRSDPPDLLESIWETLNDREQIVLRAMAETVRPETHEVLGKYISSKLNFNRFSRATTSLRRLNLIVVRIQEDAPDLLELHPVIRQFVRNKFPKQERLGYISLLINLYASTIKLYKSVLSYSAPYSVLEHWSQKAELEIEGGMYEPALETLYEAEDAFLAGGYSEEYVRVASKLFEAIQWIEASAVYKNFDSVFGKLVEAICLLGHHSRVDSMLERYETTLPERNARYINLCNLQCYCHWVRGNYQIAIDWGTKGGELKKITNVDTNFDCEHNLALARRDAGEIDLALNFFLKGRTVQDVLDPAKLDPNLPGHYYGNIGRCLQLKKEYLPALECYKYSADILEKDHSSSSLLNQAYARQWIGETFLETHKYDSSWIFLRSAKERWDKISPPRAGMSRAVLKFA